MSKRIVYRTDDMVVRYDTEYQEYSVHERGEPSDHDYFTNDLADAKATAHDMQKRRDLRDSRRENPSGGAKMPQAFYYNDAAEIYDNTPRGKLGANTTIRRADDGSYVIRLYSTDIICYHPDDSVSLNSGGHRTTLTKGRINAFLSPHIYIRTARGGWQVATSVFSTPFYDGIRIYPKGEPFSHRRESGDDDDETLENPRHYNRAHPGYKGADLHMPEEDFAYRGYSVKLTSDRQSYFISKDGHFIGYAPTAEKAREVIADLTA